MRFTYAIPPDEDMNVCRRELFGCNGEIDSLIPAYTIRPQSKAKTVPSKCGLTIDDTMQLTTNGELTNTPHQRNPTSIFAPYGVKQGKVIRYVIKRGKYIATRSFVDVISGLASLNTRPKRIILIRKSFKFVWDDIYSGGIHLHITKGDFHATDILAFIVSAEQSPEAIVVPIISHQI